MKILFITPSLEPGKDGVGDYSKRLGKLLETAPSEEVHCRFLSWNDGFVDAHWNDENLLRIPSSYEESRKLEIAREFVANFAPDWISIQWVSHGFQAKGLFSAQIRSLSDLCSSFKVHWMIHEIWLGAKKESTIKERLIGFVQKRLYRKMFDQLKPALVTTQSKAYAYLLPEIGIPVSRLPLPSNIPQTGSLFTKDTRKFIAGVFSHIHREVTTESFFPSFIEFCKELNRQPVVRHAGKNSEAGDCIWNDWIQKWGNQIQFESLGMLTEEKISEFLSSLDVGISMTPFALSDKSGVNAAFLEHRIPIFCLSDHVHFRGFSAELAHSDLPIAHPGENLLKWWRESPHRPWPIQSDLAEQMMTLLKNG